MAEMVQKKLNEPIGIPDEAELDKDKHGDDVPFVYNHIGLTSAEAEKLLMVSTTITTTTTTTTTTSTNITTTTTLGMG